MKFSKLAELFREHALELSDLPDPSAKYRAINYDKVANAIESNFNGNDAASSAKIRELPITDFMKEKIAEVISNGGFVKMSKTEKKETLPRSSTKDLMAELMNFKGIGKERAQELIDAGIKNITQLKLKKYYDTLPLETRTFLQLKPVPQIPHEDIKTLEPYIAKLADKKTKIGITGSYRRKKKTSRDIDIMITSKSAKSLDLFFKKLDKSLQGKIYPYSKGTDKMSLIIDMSDIIKNYKTKPIYKIDVFRVEPENEISMLLYSTGSKENNIKMRAKAKKMGMLLNQKGLFKRTEKGLEKIKGLKTEKDYYEALKMDYIEPEQR